MKKVVLGLAALMMTASVACAAPADLKKGEIEAGYNYSSFGWDATVGGTTYDLGTVGTNGFFVRGAIDNNWALGLEQNSAKKTLAGVNFDYKFTDATIQYKVDKNWGLVAGNRKYELSPGGASENQFIYGITGKANLGQNLDGYVAYFKTKDEKEYQVGVSYELTKQCLLDVNYKTHETSDSSANLKLKGFGVGLSYKF